jgi:hypothetical protein
MIHRVKQKPHRTETRIIQITRPTKQIQNCRWNIAVPTNRSTLRQKFNYQMTNKTNRKNPKDFPLRGKNFLGDTMIHKHSEK